MHGSFCLQGSETVIFPCERWLAKSEDDGETVRELVPSDIITEKLSRDGNLKVTEVEVDDALESMLTFMKLQEFLFTEMYTIRSAEILVVFSCGVCLCLCPPTSLSISW